ncbi:hypothetical protein RN607_00105 [Demequina capsici]|uniref:Uncharacterized protein n=1 Tax=Demequina capsici TaxID=3075620 RepID=A0AA96FD36_9MICO|nr:hypothetical protein [Demequina sp. PMTSA13]WNM27439.1 hypothetical protein RN607_00105 [Demequina sp. PMTSA13]
MATHDDATLMTQILQWHTAAGGMDASMELMWDRVGAAALRQRQQYGVAALWENFEALANGQLR